MSLRPRIIPALELGLMKAAATLQDPEVTLSPWDPERPVVLIEEAGVVVELEFPDPAALERFQERVAALRPAAHGPRSHPTDRTSPSKKA